jgi:putative Holliday junction resolvase
MRILAIDYGTKRMGIAVSDELGMIALPLEFIPAEPLEALYRRLKDLIRDKKVALILVGMPRNMDGSYGPAAAKVRDFIGELKEAIPLPVRTWDERLTSAQANRALREVNVRGKQKRETVDQAAAAILLQSYLDSGGSV